MPAEVATFLDRYPWLLLLVAVLTVARFVGQLLSEASETWAKLLGPLGRRWRVRGERRQKQVAADIEDMQRQLEWLRRRVEELVADGQLKDDYLSYDANWHMRDNLYGISQGWQRMPPPHKSFLEFQRSLAAGE